MYSCFLDPMISSNMLRVREKHSVSVLASYVYSDDSSSTRDISEKKVPGSDVREEAGREV
jgi:hypothetical protein